MKKETIEALRAVLKTDTTVTPEERNQHLSYLRCGQITKAEKARQIARKYFKRQEAAKVLECTPRYVDMLCDQGLLVKTKWPGRVRGVGITRESLEKLLEGRKPA